MPHPWVFTVLILIILALWVVNADKLSDDVLGCLAGMLILLSGAAFIGGLAALVAGS